MYTSYAQRQQNKYKTLNINIDGLDKPLEGVKNLSKYFTLLNDRQKKASQDLTSSIKMLEKIFKEYEKYPAETEEDIKSFNNLIFNMEKRYLLIIHLIHLCSRYRKMFSETEECIAALEDQRNSDLIGTITNINELVNRWGNFVLKDMEFLNDEYYRLDEAFVRD
jgi:hypothetical protein